jgi:hypothetical protein
LSLYGKEHYKEILFTNETIFMWRKLSISKIIEFMHSHHGSPQTGAKQDHYPASVMVWWGVSYDGVTSLNFCEKGVKTAVRNYQRGILTNLLEPLN